MHNSVPARRWILGILFVVGAVLIIAAVYAYSISGVVVCPLICTTVSCQHCPQTNRPYTLDSYAMAGVGLASIASAMVLFLRTSSTRSTSSTTKSTSTTSSTSTTHHGR